MTSGKEQNLSFKTYTARDYVQDGLVAMFDGIENSGYGQHKTEISVWKDLKNCFDINLPTNRQILENSINILPTNATLTQLPDIFYNYCDHDFTIGLLSRFKLQPVSNSPLRSIYVTGPIYDEGSLKQEVPASVFFGVNNRINGTKSVIQWWQTCNAQTVVRDYNATSGIDDDCTQPTSIEITYDYLNGKDQKSYQNTKYLAHGFPYLNTRCHWKQIRLPDYNWTQQPDNSCYLMRFWIYDKILTPEEQKINFEIDKIRFGL